MKRINSVVFTCFAASSLVAILISIAIAQSSKDAKPSKASNQPEAKLPPGWTLEDMQACMMAGTPGKMHELLANDIGKWEGQNTMWMSPDAEPITNDCSSSVTPMLDGRFTKIETTSEIPGMGPYHGFGIYGFDNVSQQFVANWLDNHSTGIMNAVGTLSPDGKTLTWKFNFNCPLTKKPAVMREVDTITSPTTKTIEMFGEDPKSGKEFKMIRMELTKKS